MLWVREGEQGGTAGPLRTTAQMDERWGEGHWLPMPRFMILQASGKRRPIDDVARNDHRRGEQWQSAATVTAETGTQDMPDGYRFSLVRLPSLPTA